MKTKYYWHLHHEVLLESLTEPLKNRIKYIKEEKPEDEIKLRLRLIKPVKGKLPSEVVEADQARVKAYQAWVEADQAWVEADQAWVEADQAWVEADQAWVEADQAWVEADQAWVETQRDYMPALKKLHKSECGCGFSFTENTIFTKKNGWKK